MESNNISMWFSRPSHSMCVCALGSRTFFSSYFCFVLVCYQSLSWSRKQKKLKLIHKSLCSIDGFGVEAKRNWRKGAELVYMFGGSMMMKIDTPSCCLCFLYMNILLTCSMLRWWWWWSILQRIENKISGCAITHTHARSIQWINDTDGFRLFFLHRNFVVVVVVVVITIESQSLLPKIYGREQTHSNISNENKKYVE